MLGVVELLKLRGLDTSAEIKLVRHQDSRNDLYQLMITGHLETYQSFQSSDIFGQCDYIVSFLGMPRSRARFLGVYQVKGTNRARDVQIPEGYPLKEDPDNFHYDLEEVTGFEDLKERVIINWGKGAIAWHQWLKEGKDKEVLELLAPGYTKPWPDDYLDVFLTHDELVRIVNNPEANIEWVHKLSTVAGVYLITFESKLYVGSAYGAQGIWGRWQDYSRTGHGGNEKLKALLEAEADATKRFRYSILRTLPKSTPKEEVIQAEYQYMEKLGSRAMGLN